MKKRKQPAEIQPSNVFHCCGKSMESKEFMEHITNDHNLTKEQFKGKKQMTMHIDGATYFMSTYEWELETGLKFTQCIEMPREKDDPMRYG